MVSVAVLQQAVGQVNTTLQHYFENVLLIGNKKWNISRNKANQGFVTSCSQHLLTAN